MEQKEEQKLEKYRDKALKKGYISRKEKKYLKSKVNGNKAEIKLKGDWTDHLKSDKWSLRVKISKNTFNETSIFSIQHPKVRLFLDEYFLHYWCEKEGVLTTKYDFIDVIQNDLEKGVYAFEEHFSWSLLERFNKTKAPILKFNEDDLFEHYKWKWEYKGQDFMPAIIESAPIETYEYSDILKDRELNEYWERGRALLFDYQWNKKPASEIFDLDQAAKYYAIICVTKSYHALTWHNQRFYYNPDSKKLEHILYDGSNKAAKSWVWKPIYGFNSETSKLKKHNIECYHPQLFLEDEFIEKYLHYLQQYSNPLYLKKLIKSHQTRLDDLSAALSDELEENIFFDSLQLYKNAEAIHQFLPEFEALVQRPIYKDRLKQFQFREPFEDYKGDYPSILVKAYDRGDSIQVLNFYPKAINIENHTLEAYKRNTFPKVYLVGKNEKNTLRFSTNKKEFKIDIIPFALPNYSN